MSFLHRRSRPVDRRFLEARVALFTVGAVLGLAGIYLDTGWMVGLAIGVLAVGLAIRFAGRRRDEESEDDLEEDEAL